MGSVPHLAIYFYFESPRSTEPELKLESPHPSINTATLMTESQSQQLLTDVRTWLFAAAAHPAHFV